MKVYLAGPYPRRAEIDGYRRQLERFGFTVTSRWLGPSVEAQADPSIGKAGLDPNAMALNDTSARTDIEDIMAADVVVSFTEPDGAPLVNLRGGRHVEFGIALAWDKELIIVGRRETVFHYLDDVHQFDTWLRALAFMCDVYDAPYVYRAA